jgi:hypothetical protein
MPKTRKLVGQKIVGGNSVSTRAIPDRETLTFPRMTAHSEFRTGLFRFNRYDARSRMVRGSHRLRNMAKKANTPRKGATSGAASAPSQTAPAGSGKMQIVKGIKNTLFKAIPTGGFCVVAGVVRDVSKESGTYGDYWQFKGDFACRVEGVVSKAGTLYMPDIAADLVANEFMRVRDAEQTRVDTHNEGKPEAEQIDAKPVSIEFKLKLVKNADAKSNTGFVWAVETLGDVKPEQDKVLQLLG